MDVFIKDLPLFDTLKNALTKAGFTFISELSNHDFFSLLKLIPNYKIVNSILAELSPLGYFLPADPEFSIYNIPMSKRLLNVLERNHILYIFQLTVYPRESIIQFRNLGIESMKELENICDQYHIYIPTINKVKETLKQYKFNSNLYEVFFQNRITAINDFKKFSVKELYNICENDFYLTMQTYYTLEENNIFLKGWDDLYIFEVFSSTESKKIFIKLNINTIGELIDLPNEKLNNVNFITPNKLYNIKKLLERRRSS